MYGLFIVEPADHLVRYKPNMTDIELLFGYAWLHEKAGCFELTKNFTFHPTLSAQWELVLHRRV